MRDLSIELLEQFQIDGSFREARELKRGHIHQTLLSVWELDGSTKRYVHQKINHHVFKDVPLVMRNIEVVTGHLRRKIAEGRGPEGETTLTIVPTRAGTSFLVDSEGVHWRTYEYVENTESIDFCTNPNHAYQAARAFGRFTRYLNDLDSRSLGEAIPNFQSSLFRFEQLAEALRADPVGRAGGVEREVQFALENRRLAEEFAAMQQRGEVPTRNTHADPKINNVLFSTRTGQGVCIVDLDTCMPGTVFYDFGDLVRTTSVPAAEDEQDLSKVQVDQRLFEGVARGFLQECGAILSPQEVALLPAAPRLMALTIGVRFLTDHINGDTYFRIHHENHNLDRARCQFQVVRKMAEGESEFATIVRRSVAG